ncbi:MAG: lipoate--protein ligase family protein [Euryarchaeota archaeon]|nr:lipoate--protein ligase family protein [Euryarchaeota archaeon]
MSDLRVIDSDLAEPYYTAALDNAILSARGKGLVPDTLHLYRRTRPTVSLGYFQDLERTVDTELASQQGICLVRRASGGSSIYTDQGQMIFGLVLSGDEVPEAPIDSYPLLCEGVVLALKRFGLNAEWKPLNDVLVGGRKISGSAQTRKHGAVLHQGTILVDTDLELMAKVLRPREGHVDKGVGGMTTMRRELGRDVPIGEVKDALIEGFSEALGKRPYRSYVTEQENEEVKGFLKGAYCSK